MSGTVEERLEMALEKAQACVRSQRGRIAELESENKRLDAGWHRANCDKLEHALRITQMQHALDKARESLRVLRSASLSDMKNAGERITQLETDLETASARAVQAMSQTDAARNTIAELEERNANQETIIRLCEYVTPEAIAVLDVLDTMTEAVMTNNLADAIESRWEAAK